MKKQDNLEWMVTDYGLVWMGYQPVTDIDMDYAREYFGDMVEFDKLSFVGRYHPKWNAKIFIKGETTSDKMGGLGSATYQNQHVGDGVDFKDPAHDPIWHNGPEGRIHGRIDYPKTGYSFHVDENASTVYGPEPDSEADALLGDGSYQWDAENEWWVISASTDTQTP